MARPSQITREDANRLIKIPEAVSTNDGRELYIEKWSAASSPDSPVRITATFIIDFKQEV